jgi:precorrin-2 dehydrogenase/sirohydrochlorin ferrochelatase
MPRYYPAFLDLRGKLAVVVGGGEVAERKVGPLILCGARVRVISPRVSPELSRLGGSVEVVARPYRAGDLEGAALVFAATDDQAVNAAVVSDARKKGALANAADAPDLCDFVVPSLVSRGDLQIAVSTGGASPALARRLRRELEQVIGPEYGELAALLGSARQRVIREVADPARRRAIFNRLAGEDLLDLIRRGDSMAAEARVQAIILEEGRRSGVAAT